jgi:hypothetical protein
MVAAWWWLGSWPRDWSRRPRLLEEHYDRSYLLGMTTARLRAVCRYTCTYGWYQCDTYQGYYPRYPNARSVATGCSVNAQQNLAYFAEA